MNMKVLFAAAGALALLGAGCAAKPAPVPYIPPNAEPATQVEPTPVPEPVASSTTPAATSTVPTPVPPPVSIVTPPPNMSLAFPGVRPDAEVNKKVRIKTTLGDIVIQVDPKAGPNAASNFVYLITQKFYDGTIFHRVIPGFMIQGGDPTGTGRGGPGYEFKNDTVNAPYNKGIVAMANAGRDTNGSQFFIMAADYPLGPDYSIFGHVTVGQDVVDKISLTQRDGDDRPLTEVKMVSVTIE